jgi:hypothetical protein
MLSEGDRKWLEELIAEVVAETRARRRIPSPGHPGRTERLHREVLKWIMSCVHRILCYTGNV